MTISPERIQVEAEIAAEVKRIDAWVASFSVTDVFRPRLHRISIRSLAEHLVRIRLQVEDARLQALLEAAKANRWFVDWWLRTSEYDRPTDRALNDLIKRAKEARNIADAAIAAYEETP